MAMTDDGDDDGDDDCDADDDDNGDDDGDDEDHQGQVATPHHDAAERSSSFPESSPCG